MPDDQVRKANKHCWLQSSAQNPLRTFFGTKAKNAVVIPLLIHVPVNYHSASVEPFKEDARQRISTLKYRKVQKNQGLTLFSLCAIALLKKFFLCRIPLLTPSR
jgi:hypothetical protein